MATQWRSPREYDEQQEASQEASQAAAGSLSRRSLLRRSVAVAAVAAPVGLLAACGRDPSTGLAGPAAPAARRSAAMPAAPAKASSSTASAFQEIQSDENAHVQLLVGALGSNARPKPTFQGLEQSSLSAFYALSRTFENVGVGAYLGAAASISSKDILGTAAGIMDVEARHAGFLDFLTGQPLSPDGPVNKPLTQSQVVTAVSPFVASVNGGPSPSGTLSNDNDILNFALLLEYLEATFYNINVPKFFGGSAPGNG